MIYRYVGVCSGLKVAAGLLFFLDWLLIYWRYKQDLKAQPALTFGELVSSIISLDQFSKKKDIREDDETQPLGPDSDYNSANSESDEQQELDIQMSSVGTEFC